MKRAIVLVIDALGVGALPDAAAFGDTDQCNTLGNVARACGGLQLPNLGALGLGNILSVPGVPPVEAPRASFGRMAELSHGKDTTTGHWELAGIVLKEPFHVYPEGFPAEIMEAFVDRAGCGGYLGNKPASGTVILEELNAAHQRTGFPIIYTSADSVFQIACDVDRIPLETLYEWCAVARSLLNETAGRHNVSRVIARPYHCVAGQPERLNALRHDYAVPPSAPTVMDAILQREGRTLAVGKISDIFVGRGFSHSLKTAGNADGLLKTTQFLRRELPLEPIHQPGVPHGDAGEEVRVGLQHRAQALSYHGVIVHQQDTNPFRVLLEKRRALSYGW